MGGGGGRTWPAASVLPVCPPPVFEVLLNAQAGRVDAAGLELSAWILLAVFKKRAAAHRRNKSTQGDLTDNLRSNESV